MPYSFHSSNKRYSRNYPRKSFRRRRYSRRPGQNLAGQALSLAKFAAKNVGFLKGIVNAEKKRYDLEMSSSTVNNTAQFYNLNDIAAGDDVNQRNGNSILAKYLTFQGIFTSNAASTHSFVRYVIFMDTQNQSATPTAAQLLQNATNVTSPINSDYSKRFIILRSGIVPLNNAGGNSQTVDVYVPINQHIRFTGTATGTYYTNTLYLMILSDINTNPPAFAGSSRLVYYDN